MNPTPPPPPIYAVPPSPDRSRRSCLIAAAIVLGLGLLAVAAVIFGVYKISELAMTDPKPLPGYGKPKLVKKLASGWGIYSFPDLGYRVELPDKPKPEEPKWEDGQSLLVKGWSNYTLEGSSVSVDLDGYDFRVPNSLEEAAEEQKAIYAAMKNLKNLRSEIKPARVADKDALLQVMTYAIDGEPSMAKIYHFNHKGRSLAIYFFYWKPLASDATKEIARVLKSVKFES
jgi:tryptophan-rich sensory protein